MNDTTTGGGARVLAVFDLDGTVTRHDTLLPFLAGCMLRRPWRLPRLALALLPLASYAVGRGDRGKLKGALLRAVLGGLQRDQIALHSARFVARLLRRGLFAEALERIEWHRAAGHQLVLLSASPELYLPAIGAGLGFERVICTRLRWRADGRLDGRLAGENCRGAEKLRLLRELRASSAPREIYAYGNSRADLAHMTIVEHGLFVNGSAKVTLPENNIAVVHWTRRGGVTPHA